MKLNQAIHLTLLLTFLLLSACASKQARLLDVGRGMSPEQVKDTLGTPVDKTFRGNQELWTYDIEGQRKVVVFEGGKVKELLNTSANAKKSHELEGGDVSSRDQVNYRCAGKNDFGRYVDGGGCNLYGCWPAGGYCNQFGCSATGSCTARGCVSPTKSIVCQD